MGTTEFLKKEFSFLRETDILEVLKQVKIVQLKSKEINSVTKRSKSYVMLLQKGLVRIFVQQNNGETKSIDLIKKGRLFGNFEYLIENQIEKVFVEAIEDCTLMVFDLEAFRKLSYTHIGVARLHNALLERSIVYSSSRIIDFVLNSSEERYQRLAETKPDLLHRIQLRHIATYLGITKVSLSRIRRRILDKVEINCIS